MLITIGQISTDPGQTDANTAKIIDTIDKARSLGSQLVIFPELAIPGYASMDLFYCSDFLRANLGAFEQIRKNTQNIAVIIGFVEHDPTQTRSGGRPFLYNSAALIHNQKIIGTQAKRLLPNYEIFSEDRYFSPGKSSRIFLLSETKIGIQICEDLWSDEYQDNISRDLIEQGAELIVNISASPFEPGKIDARSERIRSVYQRENFHGHFVYANLIGSFDGYEGEVVFDGRSAVHGPQGDLIAIGAAFREDVFSFDLDANVSVSAAPSPTLVQLVDPIEETYEALVLGVKEFFRRLGIKAAFIGLSGGIDSALVAALAVAALGKENVIGVTMPSKITSAETKSDALLLAKNLGIRCDVRPIAGELEAWKKGFVEVNGKEPSGMTLQNKQARIRGALLMEYSGESSVPGVVLTTGNKTEIATGYCTLYGDMCGALAVLGDVGKLRVYEIARFVNRKERREVIPQSTIDRVPTAELAEGQEDRLSLPADYPVLGPLVDRMVEDLDKSDEIHKSLDLELIKKVALLVNRNEFKRRQAAPGIRVSRHAFGVGRRLPMG